MLSLGAVMDTVLFLGSRASLVISSRVSTEVFAIHLRELFLNSLRMSLTIH